MMDIKTKINAVAVIKLKKYKYYGKIEAPSFSDLQNSRTHKHFVQSNEQVTTVIRFRFRKPYAIISKITA